MRQFVTLAALCVLSSAPAWAAQTAPPETGAPPAPVASGAYTIENCVNALDPARTEKTAAGYRYWFVDRHFVDGRTLKLSVVEPGKATHAPHVHAGDEFLFVLEGEGEFYLAGERKRVGPMTSVYCPPGVEHGLRNVGQKPLKYLVIQRQE